MVGGESSRGIQDNYSIYYIVITALDAFGDRDPYPQSPILLLIQS